VPTPEEIPGYAILGVVGQGGMGVVHEAYREADGQRVALKVAAPHARDAVFAARFQREVAIAASLHHPNVVPIVDASPGDEEAPAYLAMLFVEGTDLGARIRDEGPLPADEVGAIVGAVGAALDAAHAAGLVHRDVKPANVLLGDDGAVYLADFGLTQHVGSTRMTATGMWVGTVDYASPEQIQDQPVDARADVYALAALAFHALSGEVPFPRSGDMARLWAHVNDPRPALPDSAGPRTPELSAVVARGMAVDPDQRPQSAGDLARCLSAALEGHTAPTLVGSVATGEAAPIAAADPAAAAGAPAAGGPTVARILPRPPAARRAPDGSPLGVSSPDGPPRRRPARLAAVAVLVLALLAAGTLLAVSDRSPGGQPASPPPAPEEEVALSVEDAPTTVSDGFAVIRGRTTPGARVEVDGQPAEVDGDRFERRVELQAGENRIPITATRDGLRSTREEVVVQRAEPQPPVQQAGEPSGPEPTSPDPTQGPAEPAQEGPDGGGLAEACNGGDLDACDALWDSGPETDEQYEAAATCGGQSLPGSSGQTGVEGECEDSAEFLPSTGSE